MKNIFRTLSIMLIYCALLTSTVLAAPLEDSNTITVRGRAERQITPDTAFIVIGVITQDEKVEIARTENARKIDSIVQGLTAYGITNKEISTSSFDLSPVYMSTNNEQRKIASYSLENVLTIKVKDLTKIGNIIDSAFANGANRLDGIRFAAQGIDELQKELLQEAVADGLAKAKLVANAAGRNVGVMLKADIGNSSSAYPEARMLKATNAAGDLADSQVFVSNLVVSADVMLVYKLI